MNLTSLTHNYSSERACYRALKWVCALLLCLGPVFIFPIYANPVAVPQKNASDSLTLLLSKPQTPKEKINTLLALTKAYYTESDLEKALETGKQSLAVIRQYGTKTDSAKYFRLVGLIYLKKSWYDKSLENLMRAQQLYGESGDSSLQATSLMNIGIVHDYMQNSPMSLSYYEKALKYFKHKNDETGMAGCELNIAILLSKEKKYEQAIENFISASAIYEKTGNNSYLAAAYINQGLTYKKMGNYDLAIEYLNKAFGIWEKEDDKYHMCYYYMNMGEIMLDIKKTREAGQYLRQAEKLAQILGSQDLLAKTYEFMSDYNAARKDFASAYSYLNKSKQINDSILNAETTEKVSQIQYRYEIAKREADNEHLVKQNLDKELQLSKKNLFLYVLSAILLLIVLLAIVLVSQNRIRKKVNKQLTDKNKLIGQQKDELLKLNASKDKFLSILAHDIKNPLSSIQGISDLLVNDYDTLSNKDKRGFTQDINTLSLSLFEIINTLLTWSTSQSGMIAFRPKPFLMAELCRKSVRNLQTVAKQKDILLICRTDESLSVMADENMILSVLHNLISNAIKYSFHGANIFLETQRLEGFAQISVIDSGTGLTPNIQAKLFQYDQHFLKKGTAGETGTGLGLILCKDFVEKNGGTIRVESIVDKGSTFIFTLPLAT